MINPFKFFRKNRKRPLRGNYDKLEEFLEKNALLNSHKKPDFYKEMFTSFIRKVDEDESDDYKQFRLDFQQINKKQEAKFEELLSGNFQTNPIDTFLSNYLDSIRGSYRLPSTNILFISYWKMIMNGLNDEIMITPNSIDNDAFKAFYQKFEKVSKEEFDKIRNSNID